ncbi:MAG: diphosphomevalonate decarboxylase [Bdellovibrionota bacterium]
MIRVVASPNIAFIKYWGKEVSQDPSRVNWALNPSLSLTLSKAQTITELEFKELGQDEVVIDRKIASEKDREKIRRHMERICRAMGHDAPRAFRYNSENNFPMAAGIASSASAFAALTWATLGCLLGRSQAEAWIGANLRHVSEFCRWGSGSACRSVAGPYMLWRNEAASARDFPLKLRDTVIILSRAEKKVSSRDGHEAALSSPLLATRLEGVEERLTRMTRALHDKDLVSFGKLLEEEALEMHEVARHGRPRVEYWSENTRRVLSALQAMTNRDFYFTLDAGPNVHVISERDVTKELRAMLTQVGVVAELWEDESGRSPRYL